MIENLFKEIIKEEYSFKQETDAFDGINFIDIELDNFIFNITLEKKEHHNIILWGLANKDDLNGSQQQFHGEHYKIIKGEITKDELKQKISDLVKESFDRYNNAKEKKE